MTAWEGNILAEEGADNGVWVVQHTCQPANTGKFVTEAWDKLLSHTVQSSIILIVYYGLWSQGLLASLFSGLQLAQQKFMSRHAERLGRFIMHSGFIKMPCGGRRKSSFFFLKSLLMTLSLVSRTLILTCSLVLVSLTAQTAIAVVESGTCS